MKKIKIKISATALLAFFTALAIADEYSSPYIGASFGNSNLDVGTSDQQLANDIVAIGFTSSRVRTDPDSSGYKVIGGYQFNQNFSTELYYANLGEYNTTVYTTGPTLSLNGKYLLTATGLDFVGLIPFSSSGISGLARVGFFKWDSKTTVSITGGSSSSSTDSGSNYKFGLGAEWQVSPIFRFRVEREYYSDSKNPIRMLTAGVIAHI